MAISAPPEDAADAAEAEEAAEEAAEDAAEEDGEDGKAEEPKAEEFGSVCKKAALDVECDFFSSRC